MLKKFIPQRPLSRIGEESSNRVSSTEAQNLKQLVKAAVLEALDERKDFLQATIAEAIEDIGMGRAMDAAGSEYASRKEINDLLDRGE